MATNNTIRQVIRKFVTIEICNIIKSLKMADIRIEIIIPGTKENNSSKNS